MISYQTLFCAVKKRKGALNRGRGDKQRKYGIDILARIHRNVFPWQPSIMGNKAPFY